MENRFIKKLDELVVLSIKSKNIDRVLNNIYKLKIDIFSLKKVSRKELIIKIYRKDLEKINKLSILNEINIVDYSGKSKVKEMLNFNKTLILSIFVGFVILIFLSNIIFNIEVIHSSSDIKKLIYSELEKNGIKKYQFKKSFRKLEKIKNNILETNKTRLEWIEIERIGTKYVIRAEERKLIDYNMDNTYQDIVSTKDAVVKKVIASNGVVIKKINDYVKKGEIIISGSIYLNESLKGMVKADGVVYGEVWYNLSIEYPVVNVVTNETGKKSKVFSLNYLNEEFSIGKNFSNSSTTKKYLLKNNLLPFSISIDNKYELEEINGIYSEGEQLLNAKRYAKEKILKTLQKDEYIISDKVLNYRLNSNTIYMNIFYKVYSNITGRQKIVIEE